jgi:phytoene dehydrogenase-like protein
MTDAVVVGSGPNGLAAAVTLARAGLSVRVLERNDTIGGAARTAELTLPGFRHDLGSAVHPMAVQSPFFRRFGLERRIDLRLPAVQVAHPLDGARVGGARAGLMLQDLSRTADGLGIDGDAYRRLFAPLVRHADALAATTTDTMLRVPSAPITLARFGARLLALGLGRPGLPGAFRADVVPALLAGIGAHAIRPIPSLPAAAVSLTLGTYAHARGWPVPVGGSQSIVDALAADLVAHGGEIETGVDVTRFGQVADARAVLFDTSARALADVLGDLLPTTFSRALRRFRYGNAAAKVDFALSEPVPWAADDGAGDAPGVGSAGTVHLGGGSDEIASGERQVARGQMPESPYVLVAQPSVVDPTRAPAGQHALWAYTHVPSGSTEDRTEAVVRQIERFAPGFRDTILASTSTTAPELEAWDPNLIGGDIAAGASSLRQLVVRPVLSSDPWRTPVDGVYLCSQSAVPGPGVHGMAGWHAARSALRHTFHLPDDPDLGP